VVVHDEFHGCRRLCNARPRHVYRLPIFRRNRRTAGPQFSAAARPTNDLEALEKEHSVSARERAVPSHLAGSCGQRMLFLVALFTGVYSSAGPIARVRRLVSHSRLFLRRLLLRARVDRVVPRQQASARNPGGSVNQPPTASRRRPPRRFRPFELGVGGPTRAAAYSHPHLATATPANAARVCWIAIGQHRVRVVRFRGLALRRSASVFSLAGLLSLVARGGRVSFAGAGGRRVGAVALAARFSRFGRPALAGMCGACRRLGGARFCRPVGAGGCGARSTTAAAPAFVEHSEFFRLPMWLSPTDDPRLSAAGV